MVDNPYINAELNITKEIMLVYRTVPLFLERVVFYPPSSSISVRTLVLLYQVHFILFFICISLFYIFKGFDWD
jgi:hypothetical protein